MTEQQKAPFTRIELFRWLGRHMAISVACGFTALVIACFFGHAPDSTVAIGAGMVAMIPVFIVAARELPWKD